MTKKMREELAAKRKEEEEARKKQLEEEARRKREIFERQSHEDREAVPCILFLCGAFCVM